MEEDHNINDDEKQNRKQLADDDDVDDYHINGSKEEEEVGVVETLLLASASHRNNNTNNTGIIESPAVSVDVVTTSPLLQQQQHSNGHHRQQQQQRREQQHKMHRSPAAAGILQEEPAPPPRNSTTDSILFLSSSEFSEDEFGGGGGGDVDVNMLQQQRHARRLQRDHSKTYMEEASMEMSWHVLKQEQSKLQENAANNNNDRYHHDKKKQDSSAGGSLISGRNDDGSGNNDDLPPTSSPPPIIAATKVEPSGPSGRRHMSQSESELIVVNSLDWKEEEEDDDDDEEDEEEEETNNVDQPVLMHQRARTPVNNTETSSTTARIIIDTSSSSSPATAATTEAPPSPGPVAAVDESSSPPATPCGTANKVPTNLAIEESPVIVGLTTEEEEEEEGGRTTEFRNVDEITAISSSFLVAGGADDDLVAERHHDQPKQQLQPIIQQQQQQQHGDDRPQSSSLHAALLRQRSLSSSFVAVPSSAGEISSAVNNSSSSIVASGESKGRLPQIRPLRRSSSGSRIRGAPTTSSSSALEKAMTVMHMMSVRKILQAYNVYIPPIPGQQVASNGASNKGIGAADDEIKSNDTANIAGGQEEEEDEVLVLHSLFEDFCVPAVSLETARAILQMERRRQQQRQNNINNKKPPSQQNTSTQQQQATTRAEQQPRSIPIPDHPVIVLGGKERLNDNGNHCKNNVHHNNRLVALLVSGGTEETTTTSGVSQNKQEEKPSAEDFPSPALVIPALLQLPTHFAAAFLRLLIRLLTHESDLEYNSNCFISNKDGSSKACQVSEDSAAHPDHATRRPHLQYSAARFQCAPNWRKDSYSPMLIPATTASSRDDRPALTVILNIIECTCALISMNLPTRDRDYHCLLPPLARLVGVLGTAGVTTEVLLKMLLTVREPAHGNSTVALVPPILRLSLVRALTTACAGASRSSILQNSAPRQYFSFGIGGDSSDNNGLHRTISGLKSWPFRNDFGMAVWFRAERFGDGNLPVLCSVRSEDGGGMEISLVPLERQNKKGMKGLKEQDAYTVAVSVFDSKKQQQHRNKHFSMFPPAHHLTVRGCVLFPGAWYHLAIRHTRSRLKGVFSLTTRHQVSILLDGKTMLTESLPFPKVSPEDFSIGSASTAPSFRFSSINMVLSCGKDFDGQTGSLYIFKESISDASFRALYEASGGAGAASVSLKRNSTLGQRNNGDVRSNTRKSYSFKVADVVSMTHDDADDIVLSRKQQTGQSRYHRDDPLKSFKSHTDAAMSTLDLNEGEDNNLFSALPPELNHANFGSKIFLAWDPQRILERTALELHVGAHVNLEHKPEVNLLAAAAGMKPNSSVADAAVYSWNCCLSPQDVIASCGGIQALIPIFREVLLVSSSSQYVAETNSFMSSPSISSLEHRKQQPNNEEYLSSTIPDLFSMLAAFVQDHSNNSRELLRCGGIDVIEQQLFQVRLWSANNLFGVYATDVSMACKLVDALLKLQSACSKHSGLETKIFTRLLFNLPLWLGSTVPAPYFTTSRATRTVTRSAFELVLLPVLSSLTRENPEKVRDYVGTWSLIHILREYCSNNQRCTVKPGSARSIVTAEINADRNDWEEQTRSVDLLLGMVFSILASGNVSPTDLSPFLNLLSSCLDSEWKEAAKVVSSVPVEDQTCNGAAASTLLHSSSGPSIRRYITAASCMVLLFLLQVRPVIQGLQESYVAATGGSIQASVGWILCSMVNSFDDTVQALGVRCVAAYLDIVRKNNRSPDAPLSLPGRAAVQHHQQEAEPDISQATATSSMTPNATNTAVVSPDNAATTGEHSSLVPNTGAVTSSRLGMFAKGLALASATMAPVATVNKAVSSLATVSNRSHNSKLTPRVVFKLLWHLLKSHRCSLGRRTAEALLCWITDDNGIISASLMSMSFFQKNLITKEDKFDHQQPGYRLSTDWASSILEETGQIVGRSLSHNNPLAIGSILRLLRFLSPEQQNQWLIDLLSLTQSNRKSLAMFAQLPDWQPCLFNLLSETLDQLITLVTSENTSDNDQKCQQQRGSIYGRDSPTEGDKKQVQRHDRNKDENNILEINVGNQRESNDAVVDESKCESLIADNGAHQDECVARCSKRLDLCLDLYCTLLGHLVREGGDKALDAVEKAASLQRVCVNGQDVLLLVLSSLCGNLFDHGTLQDSVNLYDSAWSADDWNKVDLEHDSVLLQQSARLVTDAILSNGTKGLDMTSAVRSWRSLRHLAELILAVVTKSGFGVVNLFDYCNQQASAIDDVSGGLHGIRLTDALLPAIRATEYISFLGGGPGPENKSDAADFPIVGSRSISANNTELVKRGVARRLCVSLSAQILTVLDPFIFPESMDSSSSASSLHGLALVRNSEPRLGTSQGPLISSAVRLSLVLLALLEPCSVKFLQCASRLRCLLYWALELISEQSTKVPASAGESVTADKGKNAADQYSSISTNSNLNSIAANAVLPLDRMVLAIVLHCHRALGRCAALLSEIESQWSLHETYFVSRESQKKHFRRLLRVSLELRDVVAMAYRGRNETLRTMLSATAYEALKTSLESADSTPAKPDVSSSHRHSAVVSKEVVVREFLSSSWVAKFQDVETRLELSIPEQVAMNTSIVTNSTGSPSSQGLLAIDHLAQESSAIVTEFERELDRWFDEYLQAQRKWAETDAVRDLEFDGDTAVKRLAEKSKTDIMEVSKTFALRRNGAEHRWRGIELKSVEPWKYHVHRGEQPQQHWRLGPYTDRQGRRILLVQNRQFDSHKTACYDLMVGKEGATDFDVDDSRNGLDMNKDFAEVMRRNAEAFIIHENMATDGEYYDDESQSSQHLFEESDGDTEEPSLSGGDVESNEGTPEAESIAHYPNEESTFDNNITEKTKAKSAFVVDTEGVVNDTEQDEGWDKIESEEINQHVDAMGDVDGWAKAFVWSEGESVVARFESVTIVSLQTCVEGKILLTTHGLYFRQMGDEISIMSKKAIDPSVANGVASATGAGVIETRDRCWRLARLIDIHGRRYMLRQQALELFFSDSHELFLNFPGGSKDRDRFHAKLRNSCKVPMLWSPKSLNPRTVFRKSGLTDLWRKRKISNFEYIMALNRMAGRSFNDITQYPVFPWVLADYESDTIDLSDTRVYRDFTKPVGALNPSRLAQLLERYNDLELFGIGEAEKFLYGSHYSSPGIVLNYLIRQEPFTTMAIELQSGRFDCPDRLFCDIRKTWDGCMTSTADFKELIPEFFCLPEMFLNTNKFPLGRLQSGETVDNVGLPPWANGSAYEFVRTQRAALESEYVSRNLQHWVDLIFGYKQRGQEAEAAHNVFHHLSYEGSVDLDKMTDEVDRMAAETHIQNFGQTPSQLILVDPHPPRYTAEECWKPLIYNTKVPSYLRCHTPSKQFANKRSEHAKGAVLKLHIFSDTVIAIYADMSIGSYRWSPGSNSKHRLRMDKLRPIIRREISCSRVAMKRGSAIPADKIDCGSRSIGNWSFAFTIGGRTKELLRRKAVLPSSRLMIGSSETTQATAEASALLVSCGYWDDTVKLHSADTLRPVAHESGGHNGAIRCLAMDNSGGLMISGGQDGNCCVWVVDHPDMAIALSDGYIQTALGASTEVDQLLSCCHVLWGHVTPITCVDLNSDLDVAISGSQSGLVCVHTIRRGEFIRSFRPPSLASLTDLSSNHNQHRQSSSSATDVSKLAIDGTGTFVVHMLDGGLHTYTVNGVCLCSIDAGEKLHDMQICSGGEMLVTGGEKCQVHIRTLFDLQVCATLDLSSHGPIRCIAMTPDDLNPVSQYLFIGSDDGMITVVDQDPLSQQKNKGTTAP